MKSTRKSYGEFLKTLGEENKNVVVLDADLALATCTKDFRESFPDRHIDMGIAEQDMVRNSMWTSTFWKNSFCFIFCNVFSR